MKRVFSFALFVLVSLSCILFAQSSSTSGPEVAQCIHHDTSPPLRDIPEAPITHSNWQDGIVPLLTNPPRFEDQ